MDLKCNVRSLWGKSLAVNGAVYPVSAQGEMRALPDDAAKRLLNFPRNQYGLLGGAKAPEAVEAPVEAPEAVEAPVEAPEAVEAPATKKRRGFAAEESGR